MNPSSSALRSPGTLRCATWNVWWRFCEPDRRALAIRDELIDLDADVIGLQEVWATPDRNLAHWLGEQLGMHVAWAPVRLPERWQRRVPHSHLDDIGNAILSRWDLRAVTTHELDSPPDVDEAPLALSATIGFPLGDLRFCCTHLTSAVTASSARMRQVERLARHVTQRRPAGRWPVVTVGDFNAEPDSDEIRSLGGYLTTPAAPDDVFVDAWRYHEGDGPGWTWDRDNPHVRAAGEPSARVDYVFFSPDRGAGMPDVHSVGRFATSPREGMWASDHAGVWVDLVVDRPIADQAPSDVQELLDQRTVTDPYMVSTASDPTAMPAEWSASAGHGHDDAFVTHRDELVGVATGILGSRNEAEDVVQEVWFRWQRCRSSISSAPAWLRTVTRNAARDRLRTRKSRHEVAFEPQSAVPHRTAAAPPDLAHRVEGVEDLYATMGVILSALSPLERAVVVLREGLGWSYADLARLLMRSEPAIRQLRRRALAHAHSAPRRFRVDAERTEELAEIFTDVSLGRTDVPTLLSVLAPEVPYAPPGRLVQDGYEKHEVAGIVLTHAGKVLLCHRRSELSWYPDVWSLPGSHLRFGEPAAACVARAARTKLGISVSDPEPLGEFTGREFTLKLFHCRTWEGAPRNERRSQHDRVSFLTHAQAARVELADDRLLDVLRELVT